VTISIATNAVRISLELLRLGWVDPIQEAERLFAQPIDDEHVTVVGLDTERHNSAQAVEWVQNFHKAWLSRSAEPAPSAPGPNPAEPALVVLMEPMRSEDVPIDVDRQLAAAGAVVYEKPYPEPLDLQKWLEQELGATVSRFTTDDEILHEGDLNDRVQTTAGTDFLEYVEPVYQLLEKDFEELLDRGRRSDPLSTGD
jgi:hypothetical protein